MESVVTPIEMETVIETIPIKDTSDDEAKRRYILKNFLKYLHFCV